MTRAARLVLTVAIAAVLAGAAPAGAGWRSADRERADDPDVDDGPAISDYVPSENDEWRSDGMVGRHDDERFIENHRFHDHGPSGRFRHRDHRRSGRTMIPHTEPYWGTMRPYWKGAEAPGVIHRQPRTKGLRIDRSR